MRAAKDVTMKSFSHKYRLPIVLTLLVLAALACGTFTVTSGGDVPSSNPGEGVLGPEDGVRTLPPTWTPAPTKTPQPPPTRKPTQEATSTVTIPAAFTTSLAQITSVVITSAPIDSDLTDWQQIDTGNAEIWVPGDYEVVDFSDGFDEVVTELFTGITEVFVEGLSELAEDGEPIPTVDNTELESLFPFDIVVASDQSSFTSMAMIGETVEVETDLESQLNRTVTEQLDPSVNLLNRSIIEMPNFNAGRLIFEGVDQQSGLTVKQVAYIILQGDRLWTIIYSSSSDFFDSLFPTTFEKSIDTFRIK